MSHCHYIQNNIIIQSIIYSLIIIRKPARLFKSTFSIYEALFECILFIQISKILKYAGVCFQMKCHHHHNLSSWVERVKCRSWTVRGNVGNYEVWRESNLHFTYLSTPQEMAHSKICIDIQVLGAVNFPNIELILQASEWYYCIKHL